MHVIGDLIYRQAFCISREKVDFVLIQTVKLQINSCKYDYVELFVQTLARQMSKSSCISTVHIPPCDS
jgi:hypothetical protein